MNNVSWAGWYVAYIYSSDNDDNILWCNYKSTSENDPLLSYELQTANRAKHWKKKKTIIREHIFLWEAQHSHFNDYHLPFTATHACHIERGILWGVLVCVWLFPMYNENVNSAHLALLLLLCAVCQQQYIHIIKTGGLSYGNGKRFNKL